MSTRQETDTQEVVITHRDQLAAPMAAGEKPQSAWRIGTEPTITPLPMTSRAASMIC